MINIPPALKKSFAILNSFFIAIFSAFFLDFSIIQSFFDKKITHSLWGILGLMILLPIKIYFLSGLYGIFIEMASEKELFVSFKNLIKNAQNHWKTFTLIWSIPWFIHLVSFTFIPQHHLTFDFIYTHINIFLLYFLSLKLIQKKYNSILLKPNRKFSLTNNEASFIILLFLINILNYYLSSGLLLKHEAIFRLSIFFSKYIQFLTFLYITFLFLNNIPQIKKHFTYEKELYLINPYPFCGGHISSISHTLIEWHPPIFVVLKALTPKNYKITEFNQRFWQKRYYKKNILVAITCFTTNTAEAYKIAKEFKKRGATVIMGGPHVTFLPDEALQFCDSVVINEAEGVWPEVIKDFENNVLKNKYWGESLAQEPYQIHQELLDSPPEVIKNFLQTTRGCKYHCSFCSIPSLCSRIRKKPLPSSLN